MTTNLTQWRRMVHQRAETARRKIRYGISKYWFRFLLIAAAAFIVQHKDISFDLHLNAIQPEGLWGSSEVQHYETASEPVYREEEESPEPAFAQPQNVSLLEPSSGSKKSSMSQDDNLANTFSNLTFTEKEFATSESTREKEEKRRKQLRYVKRFAKVAQSERDKYGIPVSITLAQGLLESDAGESRLAVRNNNHFGIKCFSKSCKKGHCSNFTDDHHKDFFRIYSSAWESYRAHSMLLKSNKRYQTLFNLENDDFKGWARGLKKAGYATDPYYDQKLINLIEDLDLHEYD